MSDSVWPYGQQPTRLLCPQDFLDKNTGVGCHFFLWLDIRNYYIKCLSLRMMHPWKLHAFYLTICWHVTSILYSIMDILLLLLLSCFSRVQLCGTPKMAAHQAPPSLGFSRQEHEWVAISFFNVCMHAKSLQSCPTLCNPMDSSPPGSSVHGSL